MKCPKCGKENSDGSKFCANCGYDLKSIPIQNINPKSEQDNSKTSKQSSKDIKTSEKPVKNKTNTKLILIVGALIVLVAIVGVFAISSTFSSPKPQNSAVFIVSAVSGISIVTDPTNNKNYTVNVEYYGISSGSGFIITGDGYIATAAHVVADPWDISKKGVIRKMNDDDIKYYVDKAAMYIFLQKYYPEVLKNMTESDLDDLTSTFMEAGAVKATKYQHDIYIRGPAFPDSPNNPPVAKLVDMGNSENEIDVALLKVDNVYNLPALSVSSEKIEVGDDVRIYGYPMEQFAFYKDVSTTEASDELWNSIYTATLTQGIVSGERPSPSGIKYYQTDAAVDSGSSGGPVCDKNGKAIGILVQGFEKQGFNFFLPTEYLIQMCNENGISLNRGLFW
ncbi:MAG: trypsin-like peptidase domain-containing protein [Methanobacteriaceae archaeon]|jgi:S1-C subfamily serine protease|nr:trypsin-like peptidase domain-containing protein [Methanobacteriaceae archaeon]